MTSYGQYCPVAKATEIIGEKWTLLILRELLMGTSRFNDFQRSMSRISPTVLNKRLKELEDKGIILKKRLSGKRGHEYRLTPMGRELEPVVDQVARWGQRWARGRMSDDELDVELLMWDIHRRIDSAGLPDGETVIGFVFTDLKKHKSWWLIVDADGVDLCTEDPGKDVDIYLSTDVRTMVEVWQGDVGLNAAIRHERLVALGPKGMIRTMPKWFTRCMYAAPKQVGN